MPVRFCFISIQPSNWAPDFSARPAASSLCSPLPANPCASVSGSKIFTFPSPDFTLPRTRRPPLFAPRSPLGLVPPFRGAKSSHSRRRISPLRATGGLLSLLPAPRKPLWLRSGEQNLHIPAAGFHPSARPATSSLCSLLPANPCVFVSGSKIFTFPPAAPAQTCRRPPPHNKRKAPGNAIAARCFSLFSLSIIPIPLLPPAQS